ncbi:MAG: hypothetical protein WKF75_08290 [Singulisphaera sp.]
MLLRPVTLDEYERYWEWDRIAESHPRCRPKLDQHRAEVHEAMKLGDQLWEWRRGTESFSMSGGLAVTRGGEIVWARHDWRS